MHAVVGDIALRVDWLSPDVAATAARLRRLGLAVVEASGARGPVLDLAGRPLAILAAPSGERHERLVALADRLSVSSSASAGPAAPGVTGLAAIGWATVDAQRASAGLLRVPVVDLLDAGPDDALGAHAYGLPAEDGEGGPPVLFLEPAREGPLAAALARFGEGPVALYLAGAPGPPADRSLRAPAATPVGAARLVRPERPWGPFLLLVGALSTDRRSLAHPTGPVA